MAVLTNTLRNKDKNCLPFYMGSSNHFNCILLSVETSIVFVDKQLTNMTCIHKHCLACLYFFLQLHIIGHHCVSVPLFNASTVASNESMVSSVYDPSIQYANYCGIHMSLKT
eukprot:97023_1